MSKKKIMIAVPCMDQCPAPFAQSLSLIRKGDNEVAVAFQMGSLIYSSRNSLAINAMKAEYDYVFWLDSDMVFQQDILLRMIEVMDKNDLDFLTGLYYRRCVPFTPVLFSKLDILPDIDGCEWDEFKELPEGLFEVAGCGFGCVLIKTDVLFDVQSKYGTMFNPLSGMGEDIAFCWRARELGYKIYCDSSIELGHVGYSVINGSFYRSYKNAQLQKKEDADV